MQYRAPPYAEWTRDSTFAARALRNSALRRGPILLPQLSFQNLAGSSLGQVFEKLDRARTFEMRQPGAAELQDVVFARLRSRLQDHERFRHLAPLRVRNRNHDRLVHVRVGEEHLFHFQRRYVLTPAHDDLFLAVDNLNVVVPIHSGYIAGMKPAALHRGSRGLRLAPVTLHYAVASRHDFAYDGAIVRYIFPVGADHSKFHAGNCKPGHSLAGIALFSF